MDNKDLTKGTRIYFNGDMANEEGLGVIVRQITDRFGTVVDIRMDDKRFFPSISVTAFSDKYLGHGGTRFVTEEAYRDFRQDQISKVEASLAQRDAERSVSDNELDEIDDALVPKYAIQPLRTAVLVKFVKGEIDVKELARAELKDRGVEIVDENRLDELLVDASKQAEKRGEPDTELNYLIGLLENLKMGFEYQAKLAVEKQLEERKAGFSGEFNRGKFWAYKKAAEDLGKIIKEAS